MSEEEGIRQFKRQFGDLDPQLESSFRQYITERDEPLYEAINKRLLPSHLQDCINDGVCPNRGYTPTPPTPTQQAEMNRDKQEWGGESMISGTTLASVGGMLALGAGLSYMMGNVNKNIITDRFLRQRERQPFNYDEFTEDELRKFEETGVIETGRVGNTLRDIDRLEEIRTRSGLFPPTPGEPKNIISDEEMASRIKGGIRGMSDRKIGQQIIGETASRIQGGIRGMSDRLNVKDEYERIKTLEQGRPGITPFREEVITPFKKEVRTPFKKREDVITPFRKEVRTPFRKEVRTTFFPMKEKQRIVEEAQRRKQIIDRLAREAPLRPGRPGKGGIIGESLVPQQAKPEQTQSQQETQSLL
jgi:hypothetical protein